VLTTVAALRVPVQFPATGVTVYEYVLSVVRGESVQDVAARVPVHVPPSEPIPPVRWTMYPVAPVVGAQLSATEMMITPLLTAVGLFPTREPAFALPLPAMLALHAAALVPVRMSAASTGRAPERTVPSYWQR
jgi:hypothetical protein